MIFHCSSSEDEYIRRQDKGRSGLAQDAGLAGLQQRRLQRQSRQNGRKENQKGNSIPTDKYKQKNRMFCCSICYRNSLVARVPLQRIAQDDRHVDQPGPGVRPTQQQELSSLTRGCKTFSSIFLRLSFPLSLGVRVLRLHHHRCCCRRWQTDWDRRPAPASQ